MRQCVSHLSRWRDLETVIDMGQGHCRETHGTSSVPSEWKIKAVNYVPVKIQGEIIFFGQHPLESVLGQWG